MVANRGSHRLVAQAAWSSVSLLLLRGFKAEAGWYILNQAEHGQRKKTG